MLLFKPIFLIVYYFDYTTALPSSSKISFLEPIRAEAGGMQNVYIQYQQCIDGDLSLHYGDCSLSHYKSAHHSLGSTHVGKHALAKRHLDWPDRRPTKFVWLPPEDIPNDGCLHAFSNGKLVGTSDVVDVRRRKKRRGKTFAELADPLGPWFDAVTYLKQKEPSQVFVAQVKSKTVSILGAGMAGLMSAYLLNSAGVENWRILEASRRIGGRVYTTYLNNTHPDDYQYQEMGAMRFPVAITYASTNETLEIQDHKMVFQLGMALNEMNKNQSRLAVNFVPWIQSSPNDPAGTSKRRPDGTVPGVAEVAANPLLADNRTSTYSNATAVAIGRAQYSKWLGLDKKRMKAIASNVFTAHKQAIKDGLFDYSESMYLRYALHTDLNITDQIASLADLTPAWPYESVYFSATTWKTIDKGLSRLPNAFMPLVENKIDYDAAVSELAWNAKTKKITATWRNSSQNPFTAIPTSQDFDYAIVAVPFTRVRLWRLPPYSSLLSRAINTLNYDPACKVALHYKTRFWEHLPLPILGGCGTSNIPGIGSICYPSYGINSTGPGVIIGSYTFGPPARAVGALSAQDHAALVQRAMIETHGPSADREFSGLYERTCWDNEPLQAGAWCAPLVGQEELYLPAYYKTEFHTVFVGEHTSFTHAWIFSALESAVRGVVQVLLDMGLVDEAKVVTRTWMARWISM